MKQVMTYYQVLCNDGCEVSEKVATLKEARKELRDIILEDKKEFGLSEGDIDYYIVKIVETDKVKHEEIVQ